jgi:DNA ligase-1
MEYAALVAVYERLDGTDSTHEKRDVLAEAFADAGEDRLPLIVTLVQGALFPAWQEVDLGVSSGLTKRAIAKATGIEEEVIDDRWRETGDLGDAAAWANANRTQRTLFGTDDLAVVDVHGTLRELAGYDGEGSQERRIDAIARLLSDASPAEARYLTRTALGHLRIGVGEGLVRDGIALAFLDGDSEAVERAFQVTNDYPLVARTAREEGTRGLSELGIELFRPVRVMLAEKAEGLEDGIESVAEQSEDVLLEAKYDGVRVQIHKAGADIGVFTRKLEDVTDAFPDIVRAVRENVDAERCILDGEAIGYDPETGTPVTFQRFSQRIKREYDVEELVERIPALVYCFDVLALEGQSLLDDPLRTRLDALEGVLDAEPGAIERAANEAVGNGDDARAFYEGALEAGHEGVMLKNLEAGYQPGRRVGYVMKAKPTMETLDLLVTRAQYSEGRRSDFLGRLFLACRDDSGDAEVGVDTGGSDGSGGNEGNDARSERESDGRRFHEVGRLATGYTDEQLRALTDRLEALLTDRNGQVWNVEPAVVLEIEYEAIQPSSKYDSGYALRFPRFLRVREDLAPADADTLSRVEGLYDEQ